MQQRLPVNLILGGVLVAVIATVALVSLFWTPHEVGQIAVSNRFAPVSTEHWLGTDHFGRDLLTQLMVGARASVAVALIAVGTGAILGVSLGLFASAIGGVVEEALMRVVDIGFAFPTLLFAVMLTAVFGPSLEIAIAAIAFINIPIFARVARGAANQIWVLEYVLAARAAGRGRLAIMLEHILPNIAAPIIVQMTIEFAVAILAEAALSYLGLGVQPPQPSWGRMLAEAQTFLFVAPQLAIYPGLCIVGAVLGFSLLGDGLRDITDPRLRQVRV